MSDTRPPTPSGDSSSGLSPEAIAERDLLATMSSPPPPNSLEDDEVDQLDLDQDSPATSSAPPLMSAASLRNDLVVARRKAAQLKLHPYQCNAAEEFVKGSSGFKQMMLYVQLCAVENQIAGIKTAAPPFACSLQLLENIRSFMLAVLLSSKLSAYKKDSVPVGHVMAVLTSVPRSYVPDNLSGDSFALKMVKRAIQEELTQARARIKKMIKASLATLPSESDSIFDLATTIVSNTQSTVTVPLCARIALLRKVHVESCDGAYWDKVDARLLFIRNTADGVTWKITKAFEFILQADCNTYGDNTYTLPDTTDIYQSSVDDVVAATL